MDFAPDFPMAQGGFFIGVEYVCMYVCMMFSKTVTILVWKIKSEDEWLEWGSKWGLLFYG